MLKKVGLVAVGGAAALVAVAPVASAADHASADGPQGGGKACVFTGGDAGAESGVVGGLLNVVVQAPVGGNQLLNIANCSDFLNDNLNGNLSGNALSIL